MSIKYVDKINPFMNLKAITNFSNAHGDLANKIPNIIHVAGTNGKGSTIAFLVSILQAHSYSVNVFTSPHLVKENERIRIQGKLISENYNNKLSNFIDNDVFGKELSIFEKYMAKALLAFNEYPADFTILEVGLGGRLDATNIIHNPVASVITCIDFDHEHILGNSLTDIAQEKAAIIKQNSITISAYQKPEVVDILQKIANKKCSKLFVGNIDWFLQNNSSLVFKDFSFLLKDLSLKGNHQLYNASLAIVTLKTILNNLNNTSIYKGLKEAVWFGRLQKVPNNTLYNQVFSENEPIFLDGAHNPHGARALLDYIKTYHKDKKVYLVLSMLKTKNLGAYLQTFSKLDNIRIYGVPLNEDFNAYSADNIKSHANKLNLQAKSCISVQEALSDIKQHPGNKVIIICGSLYLIGTVLKDNNLIPY